MSTFNTSLIFLEYVNRGKLEKFEEKLLEDRIRYTVGCLYVKYPEYNLADIIDLTEREFRQDLLESKFTRDIYDSALEGFEKLRKKFIKKKIEKYYEQYYNK